MKIFTLTLLFLFSSTLSGQFLDIGSTWTYEDPEFIPLGPQTPEDRIAEISIIGDTLIGNELYYILDGSCGCVDYVRYIREEGLQTYVFHEGQKLLLYDYSLEAGDVLTIATPYMGSNDFVEVRIDSTEKVMIDGQEFIVQHINSFFNDNGADWGNIFIQGIGSNSCIFPKSGIAECNHSLRCFENNAGFNYTSYPEIGCDAFYDYFQIGAVWTYRKYGSPGEPIRYKIFDEIRFDFDGPNYKVLAQMDIDGDPIPETIIRLQISAQQVFWLDSIDSTHLLFDFSDELTVGDTVTYELPPNANLYDISSNGGIEPIVNPYQYVINDISIVDNAYSTPKKSFTVDPIYREIDGQIIGNFITNYISGVGSMLSFIRRGTSQVLGGQQESFICYETHDDFASYITSPTCDLTATEEIEDLSLSIYPNPADDQMTIDSDLEWSQLEVYDINGRSIMKSVFDEKIDIKRLSMGIYLLRLINTKGNFTSIKFVKL